MTISRAARFMPPIGVGLAALGLAQCDWGKPPPAPETPPPVTVTPPVSTLDRAGVVAALSEAASAHAIGAALPAAIAGRTFEIRLPFGCGGPSAAPEGLAGWSLSDDGGSITLSLAPADWTRSPLVLAPGAEPAWDRVEGFWIARPWIAQPVCPRAAPTTAPPALPAPPVEAEAPETTETPQPTPLVNPEMTAGLALIETAETSRLGRRRGETWRHVVRGSADLPVTRPTDGYRLVLGGRIGRFPEGQPIRCTSDDPDRRPTCIAAVELDLIAFEDAEGARLSEWRPGG